MSIADENELSKHIRSEVVLTSTPTQERRPEGGVLTCHTRANSLVDRDTAPGRVHYSRSVISDGQRAPVLSGSTSSHAQTCFRVSPARSDLPFNPLACHPPGGTRAPSLYQGQPGGTVTTVTTNASIGPKATQYLDLKTRWTIRQLLSTPEGFDEILTLGLPLHKDAVTGLYKASEHRSDDDMDLFCDSSDGEDGSTAATDEGPKTPDTDDTLAPSWGFQHSDLPNRRYDDEPFTSQRRMTLRVTLTEARLRSAIHETSTRLVRTGSRTHTMVEDDLLGFQDLEGTYGASYGSPKKEPRSRVKSLFNKLKRPSSCSPTY